MNKKTRLFYRRIVSLASSFILTAQSIFPAFYVLPAYAEEVSPTPTQTESSTTVTPTSTPEASPTENVSPTITTEPTSTITPEITPSITTTPTEVPSPTETISPTPTEDQIEVDPTVTTIPAETSPPQDSNSNDSQNQSPSDTPALQSTSSTPTETPTPTDSPKTTEPATLQAIILPDTNAESVLKLDLDTIVETSATVTTDKLDYAPTDTVLITGTNYLSNTTYKLKIISSDEPPVNFETEIVSNEEGNIYYSYQLDGTYRPNYQVEVKNTSGATLATTTFTDSDTAFKSPTYYVSNGGWGSPESFYSSDNNRAYANDSNDSIRLKGFGFSIPSGATITGIEVKLEGYRNYDSGGRQTEVLLSWNDGDDYTTIKTSNLDYSNSSKDSYSTLGGENDNWGRTWSVNDFSNSNFRLKLDATYAYGNLYIDQVLVKVYYSTSTPPSISISQINNTQPPFNFVCPTNPLSNPVTVSGNGGGSAPPGQIQQYHVQVDWGDGTVTNNLGTFTPNSGQGNFTYTFSTSAHTYTTHGNFIIKARLYHTQPPGNDNQADSIASVTVCIPKTGSIAGNKFNDLNGNGIWDYHWENGKPVYDEPGLSGWEIYIDTNKNGSWDSGEPKTTTNSAGRYSFTGLTGSDKRVREINQNGWGQTSANPPDLGVSNGNDWDNINFGNRQRGSIRVCKIITDGSGNVVNGSDLPTTTFSIRWDDNQPTNTTTFTSGYDYTDRLLSTTPTDKMDAICTTYDNLPIDNYHYYAETISGSTGWLTAKYNDQYTENISTLNDFYAYGQNVNSNGDINLALEAGVNRTLVILNQYSLGNLDVIKFLDYDGDGVKDDNGNEYQMSDWDMEVYSGSGCTGQVISNGSKSTNSDGVASFANLAPGNYSVKENMGDRTGWINTTPTCQNVTVRGGQTSIIYVGNFQKGSVMGCKYDDLNGDGIRANKEGSGNEPQMRGWTIRLYNSDWEKVGETVTDPYFRFNDVMEKGTYYLCEQMQSGWRQTEPLSGENYGYTAVQNQSGDETEGGLCKQITINNSGFYGSHYYSFGNQRVDAKLTISRTNNASVALAPGNAVEHTITIHVDDNNISNLKLTDLLPKGFTFRPMSYTVLKNHVPITIPSPEYHSPGVWTLGDFSKDDIITIKYWADIDSGQQSGIYKDLAWATAKDAYGQDQTFYATGENSTFVSDRFVGTEVTVNKDVINEIGVDVEKKEIKEGAVLGASTDLPATGTNELWLMLAVILLVAGSTSIYQTTKSHKHV